MGCAAVVCQLLESCDSRKVQAPQALLPQLTNFEQFLDEQPDEVQARGRIRLLDHPLRNVGGDSLMT